MPVLDISPNNVPASPLDLLTTAVTPHGYGVARDGKTAAVTVHPHAPKVNTSPNPSVDDQHRVNDILHLFRAARQERRRIVGLWKRCVRLLDNKQLWGADRPDWLPSPLIPEILPICAALVGWMTDQRIGFTVAPTAVPHTDYFDYFQTLAKDLETVMDATWQVNCEENEWTKALWDTVIYGTGFVKTTWDMTLAGGQGDAISRRVSPFALYPDPSATSLDDANYIIEAKLLTVQELDRRFPGSGALFPDGGSVGGSDIDIEPTQIDQLASRSNSNPGPIPPSTNPSFGGPSSSMHNRRIADLPQVLVFECWLREHEVYTTTDPQSGEKTQKVYDTWRVVVVAGNHVLMDEPADNLWSHGKHPYSRLVLWDTGEMWGRSLVDKLVPSQLMINRLLSALQQNIELTGNPILKQAVQGANARTQVTNRPGQKLPVNVQDQTTGWMNPPQISPVMMQLLQYYLQRMEAISGLAAITKGGTPGGRPAQSVVDSLQEAAFVRVRQHLRHLEYTMRDAGYKRASLIVENYTQPRMMAIAGPSGERTSLTLKARHFLVPTAKGAFPLNFSLSIDAGSRLHTSRAMREDRAVQLYTLQLIGREEALDDLDYPNAALVAKKLDDRDAQMAAMGAAAPGPGARQRAGH